MEISPELVTKITEKIMPEVTAWQNRPLEAVYPFVFMDSIHYKVREDHRYVTKAAYVVLGITDGRKDIIDGISIEGGSQKYVLFKAPARGGETELHLRAALIPLYQLNLSSQSTKIRTIRILSELVYALDTKALDHLLFMPNFWICRNKTKWGFMLPTHINVNKERRQYGVNPETDHKGRNNIL